MKNLILIIFVFFFFSCSSNDSETNQQKESLIGTWQYVEFEGIIYEADGGVSYGHSIENGYTYNFAESNILISNRFSCNGTYQYDSEILTLIFDCSENQQVSTYDVSFENNFLILTPNPSSCYEGCSYKYRKL